MNRWRNSSRQYEQLTSRSDRGVLSWKDSQSKVKKSTSHPTVSNVDPLPSLDNIPSSEFNAGNCFKRHSNSKPLAKSHFRQTALSVTSSNMSETRQKYFDDNESNPSDGEHDIEHILSSNSQPKHIEGFNRRLHQQETYDKVWDEYTFKSIQFIKNYYDVMYHDVKYL